MATPEEIKELKLLALSEIQKSRSWTGTPGPQHADDPQRLLGIMQNIKRRGVKLTQAQADSLYQLFHMEAQQYRQHWNQYFAPSDSYKEALDSIKAMLGHLTL